MKYIKRGLNFILIALSLSISACHKLEQPGKKITQTKELMSTIVQLDVCADYVDDEIDIIFDEVWDRLIEISWRMNVYDAESDVAKVNKSFKAPVSIGSDTYEVLVMAKKYYEKTRGTFDITVWPIIKLWRAAEGKGKMPTEDEILQVKKSLGAQLIDLPDEDHVQVLNSNTMVDLGGIAKGYAIDEAARIFREHNVDRFFIDAGGDIYAGGKNCNDELWKVGIKDPRDTSKIVDIVKISDKAVATSGNYERHFKVGNRTFSHIIDPRSGYPQEAVVSASVIADTAIEADAYATALTVLGNHNGTELINNLDSTIASIIFEKNGLKIVEEESNNYKKFKMND